MSDLTKKVEELIPQGDGHNSEYADILTESVARVRELECLLDISCGAVIEAGYEGYDNKLKAYLND